MNEVVEVLPKEETALAKVEPQKKVEDPPDVFVVASTAEQMQEAQKTLIKHFKEKSEFLKAGLKEAIENFELAKKNKWKTAPWKKAVDEISRNVEFYGKLVIALEEGYVIVPNYDGVDIFAVRTCRGKPRPNLAKGGSNWVNKPEAQESENPPPGEGKYVNADATSTKWTETKNGADNKPWSITMSKAIAHADVDFPFKLVKPEVLDKTAKAMKLLVFDKIGIVPGRTIRRGDPMILGMICTKKKQVTFLITWFVDTRAI